jgi:hypothetical protein
MPEALVSEAEVLEKAEALLVVANRLKETSDEALRLAVRLEPDLRSLAAADPERFGDAHALLEELVVANLRGVSTSEHGGEFVPEHVGDIVKLLRGEQNR